MLLQILDKDLNKLGIVDNAEEILWEINLYKSNTFQIKISPNKMQMGILTLGNLVVKKDDTSEVMVITSREIKRDDKNVEQMIIKGFGIDYYLSNRITGAKETYKGNPADIIYSLLDKHVVNPTNINRALPFVLQPHNITIDTTTIQPHIKVLSDEIYNLCQTYNIKFNISCNLSTKQYFITLTEGLDRSTNQTSNNRVIFSQEYENITNQSIEQSNVNAKNTAIVYGEGEGTNRKSLTVNDEYSSFDRLEIGIDARDLQSEIDELESMTDAEYNTLLKQRGLDKLNEFETVLNFDFELLMNNTFKYRRDFVVGDKVTILDKQYGIVLHDRIVSIQENYNNNGFNIDMKVGNEQPSLISIIKERSN